MRENQTSQKVLFEREVIKKYLLVREQTTLNINLRGSMEEVVLTRHSSMIWLPEPIFYYNRNLLLRFRNGSIFCWSNMIYVLHLYFLAYLQLSFDGHELLMSKFMEVIWMVVSSSLIHTIWLLLFYLVIIYAELFSNFTSFYWRPYPMDVWLSEMYSIILYCFSCNFIFIHEAI